MTYDVIKGNLPRMPSVDLGKVTMASVSHVCHLAIPIHVHITSKNTEDPEDRKFQALKWYGTQISLDMTLEIRSQVKGQSKNGFKIVRENVKLFKD